MVTSYIFSLVLLVLGDDSCSHDDIRGCDTTDDNVSDMPYWGDLYTGNMYSGYLPINKSCNSAMFYWVLEKEGGSEPGITPVLLWLNGGPGASSIDGLLTENIGPYQIVNGNTFTYNEHAWTDKYNILIIDNPVGTGYSYTDDKPECYCSSEAEVAADFYVGLDYFFTQIHTEYENNPFWLVGESYAGKYIPHIADYLMKKTSLPFEGVILGNGFYMPEVQYMTVPNQAFHFGIIDDKARAEMMAAAIDCVDLIKKGKLLEAAIFCEAFTNQIYDDLGGGVFRYDVRFFGDPTPPMSGYLNSKDVQSALHTTGHTWTDSDESGPVSDALLGDFCLSVMPQLESLLQGKKKVILYNGQMDGSACNNAGNTEIMDLLKWEGQEEFKKVELELWRTDTRNAVGFRRMHQNLAFVTIVNAGHMVPMTQPMHYRIFLDAAVAGELAQTPN